MKKIFSVILVFMFGLNSLLAQTVNVTGVVTGVDDGQSIPGVSVVVLGTMQGTVTNAEGRYTLNDVPADASLRFTYMGMSTQNIAVGGRQVINVELQLDAHAIDELVVTALGISRERKSLGYAIQEVKSDELTQAGQISITGALTGKVAGVQVNRFGGTVGASSRITIRGNTSFAADQQPLIIVDGVPISNDTQRTGDQYYYGVDYGSGINNINPEDIESITVLKGGSAAMYGMRAGRGVVLITTKKGKSSQGVEVSYDGSVTFSNVANIPKMQNSYGQGFDGDEMHWNLYGAGMTYQQYAETHGFNYNGVNRFADESWGPRLDIGLMLPQFDSPVTNGVYQPTPWISRPNNLRDFFQTGYAMNHTISISSNNERATTRLSLSYRDEKGTVPNTDQKNYTGQFSSLIALNKQFSLEMSANYTHTNSDNLLGQGYGENNPINGLFVWSARQINMKELKDNWDQKDAAGNYTMYNWTNEYHINPYFNVHKNTNSLNRNRLFGKTSIYYQPFDFMKIEGRLGVDYYQLQTFERYFYHWDIPDGNFDQRNTRNIELNLDLLASFNKTFGDINVSGTVGGNFRDAQWAYNRLGASRLTVPGIYTISNRDGDALVDMSHSHIRSNSVYGLVSLGWRNQLYLDVSGRNDWSSTILDPFFYPGASVSWIATESFDALRNDVLSFLKLRFGLSQVGAATSAYRNRAYYFAESAAFDGVAQTYRSMTFPNPNLRPEKMVAWEPGIEVSLFDHRLYADVTYFQKNTSDQIITVPTSNNIGFTSFLLNAGRIETKGWEIQLRGQILRNPTGLNWTSTLNFSQIDSKVTELSPEYPTFEQVQLGWTWGITNAARVGEEWGVLRATGLDRVKSEDNFGDGAREGDIKVNASGAVRPAANQIIGRVSPKFLTSLNNEFNYKSFSFGFFLDMRIGGDIWSQTMSHCYYAGTASITAENGIRERMIVPGVDVMKDKRFVMQDANGRWVPNTIEVTANDWFWDSGNNEFYVFDGSFLKLREAYITYNLPSSLLSNSGLFTRASVSFVGSNLWLMWVHKSNNMRLDPETGGVSSDTRGIGFEQASVPNSRNYGIKLSLTF